MRLYRGLCNGSITKEVVTEYMQRPNPASRTIPKEVFPYGDNHFTLDELLEKPEVLSYLRRKSVEKNRKALRMRLYKGLRNGSITKKVVTEYMQRPNPISRRILSELRPHPKKKKPVSPPRLELPKRLTCDHGITEEISGGIFFIRCGLEVDRDISIYGKRRIRLRKPKKEYISISPSEVSFLEVKEKGREEIKNHILGLFGLLDEN